MRTFHLYAFSDGNVIVITRGETEDQAMSYACRNNGQFSRGVTVHSLNYLPINAKELYAINHTEGWLHRKPLWLQKAEEKQALEIGVRGVIDSINLKEKLEVLLFKG